MANVDAIICYHNHDHYLERCVHSLQAQVRQILVVNDGSAQPLPLFDGAFTELRRGSKHSPANSFNYGAFHSNAEWLLYVDPHTLFAPKAVKTMLKAAGETYDFVLGTGYNSLLDPDNPWAKVLHKSDFLSGIPLTFLISRELFDSLGGIPEASYCHMDVLAKRLTQKGIMYGLVKDMCHHHVDGDLMDVVRYYYQSGYSYAHSGLITPGTEAAREYTDTHLGQLLSALFGAAHSIGSMEGLGKLPQKPLDIRKFMVQFGEEA